MFIEQEILMTNGTIVDLYGFQSVTGVCTVASTAVKRSEIQADPSFRHTLVSKNGGQFSAL